MIAARLDALPQEEKELLQDASVLGKVIWEGALAAISKLQRPVVEERLHALRAQGVHPRRAALVGRGRDAVLVPPPADA